MGLRNQLINAMIYPALMLSSAPASRASAREGIPNIT
jgi:hypothetical protein